MSAAIDAFLDLDFSMCPQNDGGCLGSVNPETELACSSYEEAVGVMSWSEIKDSIQSIDEHGGGLDRLSVIHDTANQSNIGSCVGQGTCNAGELLYVVQHGADGSVALSGLSLYKRIGRSRTSGAFVSDGIKEFCARGALPLDTPENRERFQHVMGNGNWGEDLPRGWEATAKQFCGQEYHTVNSPEGIFTALCNGHPVIVGREGHCIPYVRPMLDRRGNFIAKYENSWGANWGDNGFGYDSLNQVKKSASARAFVLRTVL